MASFAGGTYSPMYPLWLNSKYERKRIHEQNGPGSSAQRLYTALSLDVNIPTERQQQLERSSHDCGDTRQK